MSKLAGYWKAEDDDCAAVAGALVAASVKAGLMDALKASAEESNFETRKKVSGITFNPEVGKSLTYKDHLGNELQCFLPSTVAKSKLPSYRPTKGWPGSRVT